MIRVRLYDTATGNTVEGDEELIDAWESTPSSLIWIDCFQLDAQEESALLQSRFGLHHLAIQDAQRDRHPAKIERFDDATFLLLKGLDAKTNNIEFGTIQIALFVGERFLVTRHSGVSLSIDRIWDESPRAVASPALKALRVCRAVVDRYMPILFGVEARLDELEDEMIARPNDALLAELVRQKSHLKKLRRIMTYHVQVFGSLRTEGSVGFPEDTIVETNDVYEHLERAASLGALYYELASDLQDGYLSMSAHRLNHVMKVLTIVTAIFVPLGFLAGIYGMNFEYMPELKFAAGYYVLLGTMGCLAAGLLWLFRRKGWL